MPHRAASARPHAGGSSARTELSLAELPGGGAAAAMASTRAEAAAAVARFRTSAGGNTADIAHGSPRELGRAPAALGAGDVGGASLSAALSLADAGPEWHWGALSLRSRSALRSTRSPTAGYGDRLVREGVLRDELARLGEENARLRRELASERTARLEAQARSPLDWVDQRMRQRAQGSGPLGFAAATATSTSPGVAAAAAERAGLAAAHAQAAAHAAHGFLEEQPSIVSSEDGDFNAVFVQTAHAQHVSRAAAAHGSGGRGGRSRSPSPPPAAPSPGAGSTSAQLEAVLLAAAAASSTSLSPRSSRSPLETGSLLSSCCRAGDAEKAAAIAEWADLVDLDVRFDSDSALRTTPLVWACGKGHEPLALLLLERGADVRAIDSNGDSALSAAVKRGLCDASLALIDRGADTDIMPRARSEGGLSLLELAHRRPLGMARVIERLRKHVML